MKSEKPSTSSPRFTFTRARFLKYFISIIIMFFGSILIALACFPGPYSILENSVSNLGRADLNVNGWYFFTIALWSAAFGLVPFYFVLLGLFKNQNKVIAGIMLVLYFITSAGLVMAGTFQEGSAFEKLHLYSAYFGFGGFFLAGIFTWILMGTRLKEYSEKNRGMLNVLFIVEMIVMCTGAAMFITHLLLHETGVIDFDGAPFGPLIGFPFTEWLLVIMIFVDKVFMGFIVSRFMKA